MKYMNSVLMLLSVAAGFTLAAADPTFHLKNNTNEAIQIDILQNNKSVLSKLTTIAKKGEFKYTIDINKPTTLQLFICDGKCDTRLPDTMDVTFIENGKPVTGKTLYLKLDKGDVTAQKGNKLGFTTKGYSTKNNINPLAIRISRKPGKQLTTGTKQSVLAEMNRGEDELAQKKKDLEEQKKKPAIATAKPSKTEEKSSINLAGHREKPKEVYKSDAEITQEAWENFPRANTLRKKNDPEYEVAKNLALFDLKDDGTISYGELKHEAHRRYLNIINKWNPSDPKIAHSLNQQRLAREVRGILNAADIYLDKTLTAQEKAFQESQRTPSK